MCSDWDRMLGTAISKTKSTTTKSCGKKDDKLDLQQWGGMDAELTPGPQVSSFQNCRDNERETQQRAGYPNKAGSHPKDGLGGSRGSQERGRGAERCKQSTRVVDHSPKWGEALMIIVW